MKITAAARPDQPEARALLALWHVRRGAAAARGGDVAEAERWFRAGLDVDPESGELHGNLGVLHAQAGRYLEAVAAFQRFADVAPAEPKAQLYLGQALFAAGRPADARRALEQAREMARRIRDVESAARCDQLLRTMPGSVP